MECPVSARAVRRRFRGVWRGPQGAQGTQGPPGISSYLTVFTDATCPPLFTCIREAICPDLRKVLGGGYSDLSGFGLFPPTIQNSWPFDAPVLSRWKFQVRNNEPFVDITFKVWAVCAFIN